MSNSLAIAAVTETLRNLLDTQINVDPATDPNSDPDLAGTDVTTRPPDKARGTLTGNQVNLFLYQTALNAAWRNLDMPRQVRPGENGRPPLPLNLYYMLTAYGRDDDSSAVLAHRLLGRAMSILHDHAVLGTAEIQAALSGNDLYQQIEHVRITPQALSVEEISKLWTIFQTQYRISVAYQVTVVLIDSTLSTTSPLPVLRRGQDDRGVATSVGPSPSLTGVRPTGGRPSARLGDDLVLLGQQLGGAAPGELVARFASLRLPSPIEVPPLVGGTAEQITVHLADAGQDPGALDKWAPGVYTVSLVVSRPNLPTWTTNEVPFTLAPAITIAPANAPAGDVTVTVTCAPRLRDGQRVLLLFGDRQIPVQAISTPADPSQPTTLTFLVRAAAQGTYVLRLRVDGVDSLPVVLAGVPPKPEFDPAQTVTIT
jgi:hypothetical protein